MILPPTLFIRFTKKLPTATSLPETHHDRETSSIVGSVGSIEFGFGSFEKNWHHNKNSKTIQRVTASTNYYESQEARSQGWKSGYKLKVKKISEKWVRN